MTTSSPAYQPAVPAKARDIAYYIGLGTAGAAAIVVPTISAIVPDAAPVVAQIATAILSGVGIVVHGLGVVYRPGGQHG